MVSWHDGLALGLPEIDSDHRKLIDIIAEFESGTSPDRGVNTVRKMLSYTLEHFFREESCWSVIDYKQGRTHKAAHERIVARLMAVHHIIKFSTEDELLAVTRQTPKLCQIFLDHLVQYDLGMRRQANEGGVEETTPAEAVAHSTPPDAEMNKTIHKQHYQDLRILVLDDDRYSVRVFRKVLGDLGVRTLYEAEDGRAGFELFKELRPNLILCDIHMPIVDGIDFIRHVREHERKTSCVGTPVIFITSDTETCTVERALGLKISGYLGKPVSAKALKAKIDTVIRAGMVAPGAGAAK